MVLKRLGGETGYQSECPRDTNTAVVAAKMYISVLGSDSLLVPASTFSPVNRGPTLNTDIPVLVTHSNSVVSPPPARPSPTRHTAPEKKTVF